MQKPLRPWFASAFSLPARAQLRLAQRSVWLAFGASLAIATALLPQRGWANTSATAPKALKEALGQIDAAASKADVAGVMKYYGATFSHSDGLDRKSLEAALSRLWQRYPNLQYRTELKTWRAEGNALVAETITYVTGSQQVGDRQYTLTSTLESRQRFENQRIVRQDVLAEQSKVTSGSNPPTIRLVLPSRVAPGQQFNFDAIVQEPLEDNLLLGAAIEEPIKPEGFLTPAKVDLRPLNAGGIFKVGRAPQRGENRWLSAVIVRHDGITVMTQRLIVGN
jgi:hypothetical protein